MSRFRDGMGPMWARLEAIQQRHALDGLAERAAAEDPLTDRELDVLRLPPGSAEPHEIAAELHLSANTVKTHAKSVYRKLGAHSRTRRSGLHARAS